MASEKTPSYTQFDWKTADLQSEAETVVYLHIVDLRLGKQQFFVIVSLSLLTLCLEFKNCFLGVSEPLPEVSNLEKETLCD